MVVLYDDAVANNNAGGGLSRMQSVIECIKTHIKKVWVIVTPSAQPSYYIFHTWPETRSMQKSKPTIDALISVSQRTSHILKTVINETLRLHPVVPTGDVRMARAAGAHITTPYIPPNTTTITPRYERRGFLSAKQRRDPAPENPTSQRAQGSSCFVFQA